MPTPTTKDIDDAKAKVRDFLAPLLSDAQLREASRHIAAYTALAVKQQRDYMTAARRVPDPLANLVDVVLNGRRAR